MGVWLQRLILLFAVGWPNLLAAEVVNVGAYEFPPFYTDYHRETSLLTKKLVRLFNSRQTRYHFHIVPTTPERRYADFKAGKFDVMFFESRQWGWKDHPVEASRVFLSGGERYVALKNPHAGRTQKFFDDLSRVRIAGIEGYHYGFADFKAEKDWLQSKYRITLITNPHQLMGLILNKKADIAVVTMSWLETYLQQNPAMRQKLLISKKLDQVYSHTILVRKGFKPGVAWMNQVLLKLKKSGALRKIFPPGLQNSLI